MIEAGACLAIVILLFVGAFYLISQLVESIKSMFEDYGIRKTEKRILNATRDPQITKLIMWLRKDLEYGISSRAEDKLTKILQNPEKAHIAFRIALLSNDEELQKVGIIGIIRLKKPETAIDLMVFLKQDSIFEYEALDALVEISYMVPIEGRVGFISIYYFLLRKKFSNIRLRSKVGFIERLLSIAIYRRNSEISIEQYQALFNWSNKYCDLLIHSNNTSVRHLGEDLRSDIQGWIKIIDEKQKHSQELIMDGSNYSQKVIDQISENVNNFAQILYNLHLKDESKTKKKYRREGLIADWDTSRIYQDPSFSSQIDFPTFNVNYPQDEILPSGYRRSDYYSYGLSDFDIDFWGLNQPGAPDPWSSGFVLMDMMDGDLDGFVDFW